jgi:hypothetical protein
MRARLSTILHLSIAIGTAAAHPGGAQTQYRNLDAGRPGRIEDAEATARYSLDVDLTPFQIERLTGGTTRYRAEPRVGYGILPFTEIELRVPVVQVNPPSGSATQSVGGIAGLSLGALRAFNLETTNFPALAAAAEVSLPAGNLAPTRPSYLLKGLLTKTTGFGRLHLNAGFGSYAIRPPPTASSSGGCTALSLQLPGDDTCSGGPPIIIDVPCSVMPHGADGLHAASRMCMPPMAAQESTTVARATAGNRWFAGLAFDRSFPLRSLLFMGDVFTERFVGLYPTPDWTAEVGLRYQLTPLIVLDAGMGRHFAGVIHSTTVTIGATYEFATPPWLGR